MIRIALLWHMHQPMYTDAATGEALLPWVRLHATRAYYDMGRMLERHPEAKATVNFVPSLLEQLDAIASGSVRERYLELARARPGDLPQAERAALLRQFFMTSHERWVRPVPRYRELLQKRGDDPGATAGTFTDQELRDVQVHFALAWMGFAARREEPVVAALLAKGGNYSEEDKAQLLEVQQSIVRRVVPLWRALAARGQVELSSTPYFHPILPLLCDSDAAARAMPTATLPPRFSWPDDAREQVRRALALHERMFGARPKGMWPAEGSVSPEAAAVLAGEGVGWIATDEWVLARSTPAPVRHGHTYQPWEYEAGGRRIAIAFRDHALSDRVGFAYARMDAADAVDDFFLHVRRAAAEAREAGLRDPILPVVLDGENAWEHYSGGGEAFLDALYTRMETDPGSRTATMSEALSGHAARLQHLHSGSWIDANYRIWIGHPEDNLGWELLGAVRKMVAAHEARGDVPPDRLARAKELLLQAEGSDWFWWYGDDFQTDCAAEFDLLFRERLLRAASLVNEHPPRRLHEPISARARAQSAAFPGVAGPTAIISPRIDGRGSLYAEWLGAGHYRPAQARGTMYQAEGLVAAVHFGCDRDNLYLRLDPSGSSLEGLTLRLTASGGRATRFETEVALRSGDLELEVAGARGACGAVLELALPLAALGLAGGDRGELVVELRRGQSEVERLPRGGVLPFDVPDADFEGRHWYV